MGTMGDVLDDVTDDNIDAHHVLRGVNDWKARVKRLHATASGWLPEDWTAPERTPCIERRPRVLSHPVISHPLVA